MIDLYNADFSTISGTDLLNAIRAFTRIDLPPDDRAPEGYIVDFKEKWTNRALHVIAGFANTFGGIIIIGVSEEKGKAKEIVGEESATELKTRFAGSISANITPSPLYDIAECETPGDKNRRLCVIRVRPANRIHFLTAKGESPVYVRNEDQAIPARAAELQSLIARDRISPTSSTLMQAASEAVIELLPIYRPRPGNPALSASEILVHENSVLRISIVPEQRSTFSLDYHIERLFEDIVGETFPQDSFRGDQNGDSDRKLVRKNAYFRIDDKHLGRGMESKWLITNNRDFGYATQFSVDIGNVKRIWSLPDFALQLAASIRTSHSMLEKTGYLGEARVEIWVAPVNSELSIESGTMPFVRYASGTRIPWPLVIPAMPHEPNYQGGAFFKATVSTNFNTRTEELSATVADLLNQVLRDMHYGADLNQLKQYTRTAAKTLPVGAR
jgi:Putative DNA-binding domain